MKFSGSIFSGASNHWSLTVACSIFLALSLYLLPVQAQEKDDVIKVDTELAAFEVTVTDKDGRPIRDLTAADFRVFEDGIERRIDFFQPIKKRDENRPMSIVFALDVSGSMTVQELERLQFALRDFINRLADYNSYFAIMAFGMEVKTLQSFTNRPDKLEKALGRLQHNMDGLSTHAYDAVDDAIRLLRKKSPSSINGRLPKRTVILVTDGFPVGDTVSPKTVIERANEAETTVYSIILPSYSRLQGNGKPLLTPLEASGLIDRTGGRSFYANEKSYEPLLKALAEEITASYALAFYPDEKHSSDGKFHEVRIEARRAIVKQNRTGYRIKP
jgi:Ca-activated chloride channel homolog